VRRSLILTAVLMTATVLAGRAAPAPPGRPSVPVLRETLQEILRTGYQLTEPPEARLRELLARLLRAIRGFFSDVSEMGPLAGLPDWLKYLLMGVLVVALVVIVAHMVASFSGLLSERRSRQEAPEPQFSRLDPRDVLERAEDAFRRGEHDAAMRLLYLAVLLRLDRLGLLPHDPARTNWENLRALTVAGTEARDAMTRLTREVDACVYGGRHASPHTWELARGWADLLWRVEAAA